MRHWIYMLAAWSLLIVIWTAFAPADPQSEAGHVVTGKVRHGS